MKLAYLSPLIRHKCSFHHVVPGRSITDGITKIVGAVGLSTSASHIVRQPWNQAAGHLGMWNQYH